LHYLETPVSTLFWLYFMLFINVALLFLLIFRKEKSVHAL
jgi:hypothetical protein